MTGGQFSFFTDGSCKQNTGLCGDLVRTGRVGGVKEATVTPCIYLLGELVAILIALEFVEKEMGRKQITGVIFFRPPVSSWPSDPWLDPRHYQPSKGTDGRVEKERI